MMRNSIIIALLASAFAIASCKKKGCTDPTATNYSLEATKDDGSCTYAAPAEETGKVTVALNHYWVNESTAFQLETQYVHPTTNDTLTFTTFKYFISNFRLKKEDGSLWTHPESYFLLDASIPSSMVLNISNVPSGTYTEMRYTMGVDSIRNVSGAQTGVLSAINGMFWSWNSGYIMIKAEGMSPNSPSEDFVLHLGGFKGDYNVVTVKTSNFGGEPLNVSASATPQIHFIANPARFWHTNPSVSSLNKIHMPGAEAKQAAIDFYDGIFFDHIHP